MEVEVCYPALVDMPTIDESKISFILGEPFLRKFYTVYDVLNNKIGIGLSK